MLGLLERFERLNLSGCRAHFRRLGSRAAQSAARRSRATEKIIVNPNGVDPEHFRPRIGGERVRQELEIADDETLVGFVGSFGPWHGVLALAEAIKLMPADARVRFLLVGSGALREEVERICVRPGALSRVIFTGSSSTSACRSFWTRATCWPRRTSRSADGSDFLRLTDEALRVYGDGPRESSPAAWAKSARCWRTKRRRCWSSRADAVELSAAILRLMNSRRIARAARRGGQSRSHRAPHLGAQRAPRPRSISRLADGCN